MPASSNPHAVIIAGPNGAGKSTLAPDLLNTEFRIHTFVNADVVAQGLAGFEPRSAAIQAGRVIHRWFDALRETRSDFAFETTLSGLALRRTLQELRESGYETHLVYLWLPSPDLSVQRVRLRVQTGGHDVPVEDLRRRFLRSVRNFEHRYRRIVTDWRVYHAVRTLGTEPRLIARGAGERIEVVDPGAWRTLQAQAGPLESGGEHDEGA